MLLDKINEKKAVIGVIGLGYVGLPLTIAFLEKGYRVIGFDIDEVKLDSLKNGQSYLKHLSYDLSHEIDQGVFLPSSDFELISSVDVVIICVPTPLDKYRNPDLSPITDTANSIKGYIKENQLVVLESSTYPGTTIEVLSPILEESGLTADKDFFVAYSPEREDPGNLNFNTTSIPKLVGADSNQSRVLATALYEKIIDKVFEVSGTKVAEAAKLTENIFRSVNIALVNELKVVFDAMEIDVWEVIDAASTKPFGYMPFFPGPGLGGHCIPVDPFYLTYKSKEYNLQTKFIELAAEINTFMPEFVIKKINEALNSVNKSVKGSKVLVIGLAYKKDIGDERESPTFPIIDSLVSRGAIVNYHDDLIPKIQINNQYPSLNGMESLKLNQKNIQSSDLVVIITDHTYIDYGLIQENANLIVDTRNVINTNQVRNVFKA